MGATYRLSLCSFGAGLAVARQSSRQGARVVPFHLLKGPEAEDHTLYASHTVWENLAVFEAWTKSEAFRAAHSRAGDNKPLYVDHPQFEGFEVRQTVGRGKAG
jgi:hypothetical protein